MANRWDKTKELLERAIECPPRERAELLAAIGQEDPELRREIESLLAVGPGAESFLEEPLIRLQGTAATLSGLAPASDASDTLFGELLDGRYRMEERLGRGGMGSVYRAIHLGTGRRVAIKVIAPEFMANAEFLERFRREAKAAGRLHHPNVVNVTDFGTARVGSREVAFLVMEHLDGLTLAALLRQEGALPPALAVDLLDQTCLAVEEAHRQGILHRDLKPDNIWLEPNGRGGYTVKVLDFGLAKLRESSAPLALEAPRPATVVETATNPTCDADFGPTADDRARVLVSPAAPVDEGAVTARFERVATPAEIDPRTPPAWLTRVGMVLGTPLYMSPEQCRGERLEVASDVYSLGVVGYHMLAGEPPFSGDLHQLLVKHGEMSPPPLRERRREVPVPLAAVVMSALAKTPADRPPSAAAFAAALRIGLAGEEQLEVAGRLVRQTQRSSVYALSAAAHLPFVAVLALVVAVMMRQWAFELPGAWVLQLALWLLPYAIARVSLDVGAAALTLAVEQARRKPSERVEVAPALATVWRQLGPLLRAALASLLTAPLRSWSLFTSAGVAAEGLGARAALVRSRRLAKRLPALAAIVELRHLAAALATVILTMIAFSTCDQWYAAKFPDWELRAVATFLFTFLATGLAVTLLAPRIELARALLYLETRRANGELADEHVSWKFAAPERPVRPRAARWRRSRLVVGALMLVVLFANTYFLLVPPVGPIPTVDWPAVEAVPDRENAWQEYEIAIRKLGSRSPEEFPDEQYHRLRDYALGAPGSDVDGCRSILAGNREALDHILAGTARPRAQLSVDSNPVTRPFPSLFGVRALVALTAARSRELVDEGHRTEAAAYAMAAMRLATDLSEPEGTLVGHLSALATRRIARGALLYWLKAGGADATTATALARTLAELDRRIPTSTALVERNWRETERAFQETWVDHPYAASAIAVHGPEQGSGPLFVFPGLRLRVYEGFIARRAEIWRSMRPRLDADDMAGLDAVWGDILAGPRGASGWLFPGEAAGGVIARVMSLSSGPIAKERIRDLSLSAAVRALLVCDSYFKLHARFPERLSDAFGEAGLDPPLDPATGRPIGYRVEDGRPLVWLSGYDGKDDGGRVAYDLRQAPSTAIDGADFVVRFGDLLEE